MATDDEVLEDEPAARSIQLVGTDGVARRIHWDVALQVTRPERAELYVAVIDVFFAIAVSFGLQGKVESILY